VSVAWNPANFMKNVQAAAMIRMRQAMTLAVQTAKEGMQELGPGVHSEPGEYPASQSGAQGMRGHITFEVVTEGDKVIGRFGIIPTTAGAEELGYPAFLELGTIKMAPRPWITLTVDSCMSAWKEILT